MLVMLALSANAQETYRKSWDFTKWSAKTVENLKAESAKGPSTGAWSDVEKTSATEPTEKSKDNCFWEVTAQGDASVGTTIMANGEAISELEGLLYTNRTARSLAIAVNYTEPDASSGFGPYHGASYLWFGGSKKNYFVIPHVAPGTTIKMGVESHKLTDARGVQLYIGFGTSGTQLMGPDGNAVGAPTEYQDQEWVVPLQKRNTARIGIAPDFHRWVVKVPSNAVQNWGKKVLTQAPRSRGTTIMPPANGPASLPRRLAMNSLPSPISMWRNHSLLSTN